jgi:fumarate hydratase class II
MQKTRVEHDSLGAVEVPEDCLWGAQTQRSLAHFHISTEQMPVEFIEALAYVKRACISVNVRHDRLPKGKADALLAAADEVLRGLHPEAFPLSVWQTGSATQTNMNMNEVLANRATQRLGGILGVDRHVHPNDDVNASQSSNDVIPTAIHVAAVSQLNRELLPALDRLRNALDKKSSDFSGLIKVGRTHLQDAVPLTLGQEFSGYVRQLDIARQAITAAIPPLHQLAIGGTAVGTGMHAPPGFGQQVSDELARLTGFPFLSAPNKFAALAGHEPIVFAHGALKTLATALTKIANDIRWMSSGPRSGLGEISLPENEPGSSIMPGKVNPTQSEALIMICHQVFGNDTAITISGASGNFELNVCQPVILHNFLQSVRLLAGGMAAFAQYGIEGIVANVDRISDLMHASLMLVTALTPHIGYDRSAEIARAAYQRNISLKEAAVASGHLSADQFDAWVRPERFV